MGKNLVEIIVTAEDKASGVMKGIGAAASTIGSLVAVGGEAVVGAVSAIGVAALSASNDTRTAAADMQAQFGMTAEEADRAAQLARDSWSNNWGDSIGDVGEAMGTVIQQLGEFGVTSDEQIQGATEDAIAFRDTFQTEIPGSIDAARALMDRFGLTSDQAFDLMTTGMQSGLSLNGDFLESITEYAPVFEGAGFSAEQMYSIMESGSASGVLGTDKIADAVKEMGLKLNEGGQDTKAAFDQIGMSFDDIAGFVASGDETWADYFDDIVAGINGIEDPIERQKAQVAIFGTMAEDLGVNFTEGLTAAGASLEDFEGATDGLSAKYNSFPAIFEGIKRTVIGAFAPVGDFLLGIAEKYMPIIQETIGTVAEKVGAFIGAFSDSFSDSGDLIGSLVVAFQNLVGPTSDAGKAILNVGLFIKDAKERVTEFVTPIAEYAAQFVSWKDILIVLGNVLAGLVVSAIISVVTALGPILLAVGAVIAVVALLRNAWENNWGDIQGKTQAAWDFIRPKLEAIKDWIVNTVIPAVRDLWQKWVNEWWPAIQTKLEEVWEIVQPILQKLQEFITNTLIPAIRDLWEKWTTVWWPAIQTKLEEVWAVIEPIWESIRKWAAETIPPVIDALKGYFQTTFDTIKTAIGTAKGIWDGFVGAVQTFWNWLNGRSFDINVENVPPAPGDWSIIDVENVPPAPGGWSIIDGRPLIGGPIVSSGRSTTAAGAGQTTVVNIDARGSARGVDRDLRAMVEQVMREYGARADIRVRTT